MATRSTPRVSPSARLGRAARFATLGVGAMAFALAMAWDAVFGIGQPGFGTVQILLAVTGLVVVALSALAPIHLLRLWAIAVGLVLALTGIEITLQVFAAPDYASLFMLNDEYLFDLAPHAVRRFHHRPADGGHTVLVRINADGYRGEALRADPDVRVAVFGDSFIEAEYSALSETFAEQLEGRLASSSGRDVEVVNAGVVSYGPDQVLLRMRDRIDALAPDLVVLALYAGNDFGDLMRNKLFRIDESGRLTRTRPVLDPSERSAFEFGASAPILPKAIGRFWRWVGSSGARAGADGEARAVDPDGPALGAGEARVEAWLRDRHAEYEEYVVEKDEAVRNLLNDEHDADVALAPNSDSARYKVRLMDGVVGAIADLLEEKSIPLVVLIVPAPIDVAEHYDYAVVDRALHPDYDPARLTDTLDRIAERHALRRVNLYAPFRANDPDSLYFMGGDNHWNGAGQALAADIVHDYIVSQRLLE